MFRKPTPVSTARPTSMPTFAAIVLALLVALPSAPLRAGEDETIEVEADAFELRLEFPEPMRVLANTPVRNVSVRPERPLRCRWDDDVALECEVEGDRPLPSATPLEVRIAPGLFSARGEALGGRRLRAEVERPDLAARIRGWEAGVPTLRVEANLPVETAEVARVLELHAGGRVWRGLTLSPLPTPAPEDPWETPAPEFALTLPPDLPADVPAELRARRGLRSTLGPLPSLEDERLLRFRHAEPFRIRAVACSGADNRSAIRDPGHFAALDCVPGEALTVQFSAPLDAAARAAFEARLPPGATLLRWSDDNRHFSIGGDEAVMSGETAELRVSQPHVELAFVFGNGLRDRAGRALDRALRLVVRNGAPRPSLRAAAARRLLGDPARGGVLSVNAPAVAVEVEAIGARAAAERFATPETRAAVATVETALVRRTLAEGGWVRWRSGPGNVLDTAAPQFDLAARIGSRTVVAWALDWDDGRPVVDAEVELVFVDRRQGERRMASARTGADGVARLALPADFRLPPEKRGEPRPEWVLRATQGARRAVLPLGAAHESGNELGETRTDTRIFAVADRPLYRAGDALRYQGWLREARDGRLGLAAAREARLGLWSEAERRTLQTWSVALDAEGAFAGELALPSQLVDGDYCIGPVEDGDVETPALCVFVGTFRAQDLWAEARTPAPLLRDGDALVAEIEAGYWSGGGASGVAIQGVFAEVLAASPAEAYPDHADYVFLEPADEETEPALAGHGREYPQLDADGRARVSIPLAFEPGEDGSANKPAFARLRLTAQVGLAGREPVSTTPVVAHYAAFDRYVGLRLRPQWFDARTPLSLTGVVIDAGGRPQPGARIEVAVEYLPDDADAAPVPVARCVLEAGRETPCDVPRERSGRYRFTARSGDAAPATLARYVWNASDTRGAAPSLRPELEVIEAPSTPTAPVRLRLRQPYAAADALVLIVAGGEVLDARVLAIDQPESELRLQTFADGRNAVVAQLLVRERAPSPVDANGLRRAPRMESLYVQVDVPRPTPAPALVLSVDPARSDPGQPVRLRLHNRGQGPRTVALTVLDDALRALAGPRWEAFDPAGPGWLGARDDARRWPHALRGFADWNAGPWQLALPWTGTGDAKPEDAAPVVVIERAQLVDGLAVVGDLFAVGTAPVLGAGVAAPVGARQVDARDELDFVVVTGSRIHRSSELGIAESAAVGRPEMALTRESRRPRFGAPPDPSGLRLRRAFADTALWQPALRLAPGETREFVLTAPDNLTRWRAVAWSADDGEGFEMAETVFEVGLPLEVRLQAPVRVYPGDRAALAANLRQSGDAAATVDAGLHVEALSAGVRAPLTLPAGGQAAIALEIAPTDVDAAPQTLTAVAEARAVLSGVAVGDATAQPIELASPTIEARKVQAGWLGSGTLDLGRPPVPAGATDVGLRVSLLPGADALVHGWIDDLHRYPHRCWEQILSRAVAAAIALERGEGARFPDARAAIAEALENAPVFQGRQGGFRYFADSPDSEYGDVSAQGPLTAYSVRALRLLESLGHAVDPQVLSRADGLLHRASRRSGGDPLMRERVAFMAAGQEKPGRDITERLWRDFDALSLPAQVAAARAIVRARAPEADEAIGKLLARTERRGEARVLRDQARHDRWMSSRLREQCELLGLLLERRDLADATIRRALVAGLGDLYAGGVAAVDTQTGASCLMALRLLETDPVATPVRLDIAQGRTRATLTLPPEGPAQTWQTPQVESDALRLAPNIAGEAPASYRVEYRYAEDARRAEASAIGFALRREYAVLRDGRWRPLAEAALRDGDWVRITLRLDTGAERHFVAITDAVPGGLRPTDLALSGVGGVDVEAVSDTGAYWFRTRRLDPRAPKFYAEYLPPGRHEVHYFARVGNAGDYLAPPATAELMYGETSRARTAAERLRIVPAVP